MAFPWMTTRRLMALVAVVGLLLSSIIERRGRFQAIAEHHAEMQGPFRYYFSWNIPPEVSWHMKMEVKYLEAARSPWLPVAPDPPMPK